MKIDELNEKDKVAIEVIYDKKNYEFNTTVSDIMQGFILTDTIKSDDDKVIGFNGDNVNINLILYREEKLPIVWKGIGCTVVEYKKKMMYKIVASGEGFELNRRNAYRLYIGYDGIVQIGINKKAIDIIVKDLSQTGFAFVCKEDIDNCVGNSVRVVYNDDNKSITLVGTIVRKEVIAEDKIIYGCKLSNLTQKLNSYINEKQRKMLAQMRENRFR